MEIIIFLIFAVIAAAIITLLMKLKEKRDYNEKINKTPTLNYNLQNASENDVSYYEIQELRKVYFNLLQINN